MTLVLKTMCNNRTVSKGRKLSNFLVIFSICLWFQSVQVALGHYEEKEEGWTCCLLHSNDKNNFSLQDGQRKLNTLVKREKETNNTNVESVLLVQEEYVIVRCFRETILNDKMSHSCHINSSYKPVKFSPAGLQKFIKTFSDDTNTSRINLHETLSQNEVEIQSTGLLKSIYMWEEGKMIMVPFFQNDPVEFATFFSDVGIQGFAVLSKMYRNPDTIGAEKFRLETACIENLVQTAPNSSSVSHQIKTLKQQAFNDLAFGNDTTNVLHPTGPSEGNFAVETMQKATLPTQPLFVQKRKKRSTTNTSEPCEDSKYGIQEQPFDLQECESKHSKEECKEKAKKKKFVVVAQPGVVSDCADSSYINMTNSEYENSSTYDNETLSTGCQDDKYTIQEKPFDLQDCESKYSKEECEAKAKKKKFVVVLRPGSPDCAGWSLHVCFC